MFPIQNCAFLPPQIQRQGQREILSQSWWLVDTENHRESESATKSAKVNYPLVINTPLVISKCAANRISLKSSDMAPSCGRTMFARNACIYLSIYLYIYTCFCKNPTFPHIELIELIELTELNLNPDWTRELKLPVNLGGPRPY